MTEHVIVDHGRCDSAKSRLMKVVYCARLADWLRCLSDRSAVAMRKKIYAIAAIGFRPDPATVVCAAGGPCLNHPLMIDASRVGGSPTATPPSHSHVFSHRGAGWFNTVNIRVFNETAWNQIAAAKSLDKVRELQGNPAIGVPGVISGDTATNIYFFIAGAR